jgi:hypothetical protein
VHSPLNGNPAAAIAVRPKQDTNLRIIKMDTVNSQVSNNPDDDNMKEVVTASDVADNIMNNQVSDYDINDLMTVEEQAECFREIVGIWASRGKQESVDRDLARVDMTTVMESAIYYAAIRKGYHE